jgi:chitinase
MCLNRHKGDVIPQLPSHLQLLDDYDHFTPEYYINVAGLGSVSAADIDVITTELFSPGSGNSHEDADLSTVSDEDTHPQYFAKITACDSGPSFDFGADTSYVDHPIDQTTPSATTMPSSEPSSAIDLPEEPTPESTTVVDVPIANSSTEEPTPEPTTIVDIPIENSSTVESGPTATLKPTMSFPTNTNGPSTISATGLIRPTSTASIPYLNSTISSRLSVLASTTSTAWKTTVYTVTSCAPTVTNCPAKVGHLTTETVIDYVTVCPVTASTSSTGPITTAV